MRTRLRGIIAAVAMGAALAAAPQFEERYATQFDAVENPIAQGGRWITGRIVGMDWNDVRSESGIAFATAINTGYDDSLGVLATSFGADQTAEGVVYRAPGYAPRASHEIELLLRFRITPHNARGYEVLWGHDGGMNVVRWNGPLGNYTPLAPDGHIGRAVDGDVLRAQIVGNRIDVYLNGNRVFTATDPESRWNDGQPGIGFWVKNGATPASYGWTAFSARGL